MIPAAVSSLLDACGVSLTVAPDNRGGHVATARNGDDREAYAQRATGADAREAALSALDALHCDAHREASAFSEAAKQLAEDAASPVRREAATVRAATWRVRAATLSAVCREAAKLWPEVSL